MKQTGVEKGRFAMIGSGLERFQRGFENIVAMLPRPFSRRSCGNRENDRLDPSGFSSSKSQKLIVIMNERIIGHDPNKLTAYPAFSKTRNTCSRSFTNVR